MIITKKVVFVAKDDCIEEMKKLLKTMVQASKDEKGCLLYDIFQSKETPAKFVVIESWENDEALEGHKNSEHYKHYKSNFEPFCKEKYSEELDYI